MSALEACKAIGMPECDVILGHCVTYLAQAPKSISVYKAMQKVKQVVENEPTYSVPLHLRNAPTKLMKDLEYHKGYVYPPEAGEQAALSQTYLPPECPVKQFFE
jgi:putative ATPase